MKVWSARLDKMVLPKTDYLPVQNLAEVVVLRSKSDRASWTLNMREWRTACMSEWAGLNCSPGPIPTLSIRLTCLYPTVIMASLLRRPVDLFVVSVFLVFLLIAATIGKIDRLKNTVNVCKGVWLAKIMYFDI